MRVLEQLTRKITRRHDRTATLDGIELPPSSLRTGHEIHDDHAYLAAARRNAALLERKLGLTPEHRILDIGCGAGRLPIGLRAHFGTLRDYVGIDVNRDRIEWCRRHIHGQNIEFIHIDVANERYNPGGQSISTSFRLPLGEGAFDAICLYSVFSHMLADDTQAYLREIHRLLAPNGRALATAFLEDNVEDISTNPSGYGPLPDGWHGPLHCVRYNVAYFNDMAAAASLEIDDFDHAPGGEQSVVVLKQRPSSLVRVGA